MDLIRYSLRRPVSVMVMVLGIIVFAVITIRNMPVDIFPKIGVPTIYVAQPYGGLSPEQMEGYMTSVYEQHFIYITGVKSMESRSIQSMALIKLVFHEDTDMAEALGQVVAQVNRAGGKMPPGTTAPFVIRFDAGNVPVGQLVFSSEERSLSEIQNLAVTRIRPMFSRLPGVSSPPPVGGNQRSVVVTVDPDKLKSYGLSTEDVVEAIATNNRLSPAGTVRIDDIEYLTKTNSIIKDIKELENIPIRKGSGPTIYVRDVGEAQNSADIATGFAMVNGQRSVYIPVNKRADASTWTVVQNLRRALPDMREAVPEDIKIEYAFDQSGYVVSSLRNILIGALIASLLTGLIVVLFLGDFRSGLVVVITIPLSILSALIFLFMAGQTLNIMTLAGLALSIGVLVDEATITIENIHRHFEMGKSIPKAIADAPREILIPKLLIVLSLLAVFAPSFFMSGVPKSMFVPLSMAVGFAMISSFILAQTLVPVISNSLVKHHILQKHLEKQKKGSRFVRFSDRYQGMLAKNLRNKALIVPVYLVIAFFTGALLFNNIGTEIFPQVDAGQMNMRILAPEGTRIEATEERVKQILTKVEELAGKEHVEISSGYIGTVPSAYPASTTNIWNSGPHVASMLVKVNQRRTIPTETLKEKIRAYMQLEHPDMKLSFEPADIVDRVMSMGANNPIELAITGRNIIETEVYAQRILTELRKIKDLRDVHILQPLNYPTINIHLDRERGGQLGLSTDEVTKSMVSATSSSRFTRPIYWLDEVSGMSYQIQVEIPQYRMQNMEAVNNIFMPAVNGFNNRLRDLASIEEGVSQGEIIRLNQQRMVSITANTHNRTLGSVRKEIDNAIQAAGDTPRGMSVIKRGQLEVLDDTMNELQGGLIIALIVILLMLSVNFQSFKVAIATLSTIPAVVVGALVMLLITGSTLNIQSYMGIIMALGVSIANAILFVTFAEDSRKVNGDALESARMAGKSRLRPILMTAISMIVGMIPLALGGAQIAPLGIAVIGGLIFSTISILFFMPTVYAAMMQRASNAPISLDPYDINSNNYEQE